MPRANQLLFLVGASVLIPPTSFDYTLEYLYIPWAWIVLMLVTDRRDRGWWPVIVMLLFAVEMAPLTFLIVRGIPLGGIVKAAALAGLVATAAIVPMPENLDRVEGKRNLPAEAPIRTDPRV